MAVSNARAECAEPSNGTKIFLNKPSPPKSVLSQVNNYRSCTDIDFASTLDDERKDKELTQIAFVTSKLPVFFLRFRDP